MNNNREDSRIEITFNDKLEVVLNEYNKDNVLIRRITYKHYAPQEEEIFTL